MGCRCPPLGSEPLSDREPIGPRSDCKLIVEKASDPKPPPPQPRGTGVPPPKPPSSWGRVPSIEPLSRPIIAKRSTTPLGKSCGRSRSPPLLPLPAPAGATPPLAILLPRMVISSASQPIHSVARKQTASVVAGKAGPDSETSLPSLPLCRSDQTTQADLSQPETSPAR